jgi:hypothetical protein
MPFGVGREWYTRAGRSRDTGTAHGVFYIQVVSKPGFKKIQYTKIQRCAYRKVKVYIITLSHYQRIFIYKETSLI